MEINTERTDGVLVINAEGRIDGSNSAQFLESIQAVVNDDDNGVVLDFGGINYISSAGLRVILLLAKELRQKQTGFGVCSLSSFSQGDLHHQRVRPDHRHIRLWSRCCQLAQVGNGQTLFR